MTHSAKLFFKHRPSKFHQKGVALILMVFVLSLVVLAYMVKNLNGNDLRAKEAAITSQSLAEAKLALIGWSVNHSNTPGLMPYPDRNADPLGYDGLSDCPGGVALYSHLIGRLPWKGADYNNCNILLSGLGKEFLDGSGEPLWYAVSKNLVHIYSPSGDPVINPSIIDNPPYDDNPPSKSWLRVFDKNGLLISDKVAVIIFAPGSPNGDQDRSGGKADATNYLDLFYLKSGGGVKSNQKYAGSDEDFYIGEDSRGVRSDNTTYQQPYYFNDKLVYITIDELMAEIEKRAAGEARLALQKYYANNSFYPYAAALGSTTNLNQCVQGNLQGLLPINTASSYACTYSSTSPTDPVNNSATCSFSAVSSISFTRTSGTYGASSGACVRQNSNATCNCTGAGSCNTAGGAVRFSCDACGDCTTAATGTSSVGKGEFSFATTGIFSTGGNSLATGDNTSGSFSLNACTNPSLSRAIVSTTANNSIILTTTSDFNAQNISAGMSISGIGIPSGVSVSSVTNSTTLVMSNNATATGTNNLTFSILPDWFATNGWQNYIYYAVSSNCTMSGANCTTATPQLTVGLRTEIRSLLISSGKPITASPFASSKTTAQAARPSCEVKDYLDSSQNTNATLVNGAADVVYDATNTPRSSSYNDQMFIVAP